MTPSGQVSQYDLKKLNSELEDALINFNDYHADMDLHRNYYMRSAFYPTKSGQVRSATDLSSNLLRVYADKNIHFTSNFPTIKVPTSGASSPEREAASKREKILQAVWRKSGGKALQKQWAFDGTIRSLAVAETGYDIKNRCAFVRRYDPRFCFWQLSNANDKRVIAFWAVFPITKDEAQKTYGVTPTQQPISHTALTQEFLKDIDGKDWFLMAIRWDETVRVAWVGDQLIEEPHQHMMPGVPVDICKPFDHGDSKGRGAFYLEPLLAPQAELNYTVQRRSSIVSRMSNPLVWGRGIINRQLDDVKGSMKGGGFVGLKQGGELGILQLNDVKLLNEHEESLRADLMRLSGFSAAAMGELAGANTSGDALGMYFTPTQRHIENQNISWISFYESINAKILRVTEAFTKTGEVVSLSGYSPRGTLMPMTDNSGKMEYQSGGFNVEYTKEDIGHNYNSIVIMPAITPKNELEEKRLVVEAVTQKFLSRTTAFEMYGIESPQDELALLTQEQSEPALNPQGMQQLVAAAQQAQQQPQNPQLPTPQPVGQELAANVQPK